MSQPASPRQVLLGMFILVQIVYLLLTNLVTFIKWVPTELPAEALAPTDVLLPRFKQKNAGHAWQWSDEVETAIRRYAQLTGQDQQWGLFAPVGTVTGFPVTLMLPDPPGAEAGIPDTKLTFDPRNGFNLVGDWRPRAHGSPDEHGAHPLELMLSDNEPRDITWYLRIGNCRLRKFDGSVYIYTKVPEGYSEKDFAERMNDRTTELLRDYRDLVLSYLRWRLKKWQEAHPDAPSPRQVILLQRCYRLHDPDEPVGWDGPFVVPIARWQPNINLADTAQTLESYNFISQQFTRVP